MFSRLLKCIALFTLLIFSWTMGGGATIAHAAKVKSLQAPVQTETQTQAPSPEEQLNTILAEIEGALAEPTGDLKDLRRELSDKLHEAKQLDLEIRKEFAETEKKLKKAGLSDVILKRHTDFVAHYDVNFKELRNNIQALVSSADQESFNVASEKTRIHFNKVKPPKKYQPLDPNNLPHRLAKPTKKQPRMKKKEFEQEIENDKNASVNQRRIMVASTGSLTGLLGPDELAETIEIQFTPDIQAKAEELNHDPVKIYEWVRNNIEFVPTWGSIQGAQMALETKQGNAFDTASLLIALLRESGIKSRYVMGTVELPIEKVMNWLGGFTEKQAAIEFMASGGVPAKAGIIDGEIAIARFEHVWVEAFIDYIPSRGARHKVGDTWISLDPSYKQYDYTQGIDLRLAVPFDAQTFVDQVTASATINEEEGYATGVNALFVQQTMQDYQSQVEAYIQENHPEATVGDVLGKKEVVKQDLPYLLGTLPYQMVVVGIAFDVIPDNLRHKLSFKVKNEIANTNYLDLDALEPVDMSLRITKSLPELAGKKVTLSYSPASAQDEAIISSYLPQPHVDGTPIQPSELPSQLPAYLINVKPELRIDGQVVATGEITGLGDTNIFNMTFSSPSHGSDQITNLIDAGVYQAIGLNLGQISGDQLSSLKAELEETKAKLEARIVGGLTKDDLVGDFLNTIALTYHAEFNTKNFITSRSIGVNIATLPSETVFSTNLKVLTLFGIPRYASSSGYAMDADRLVNVVIAKDGKDEKETAFMLRSGTTSSALEHQVPEQFFSTTDSPVEGISAVKALQLANELKIPIYKITHQNFTSVMPQLQLDKQVKDDIQNAVNSGKEVTVSKTNINFNGWNGCGYIILNPETGAAGYLLSGGINGGLEEDPNASRKDAIFFVSIMASVVSILVFGPLLGLFVTLLIAAAVTAAVKYLDGDLSSITPKDVLKYVADVVVWTAIGAGIAALAISGAPFLLVLLTILLLLFPVAILDYIFINTFLIYKRYLEYV